jgi:hypothetical protein
MNIDVSIISDIDESDSDKTSEEDNVIFICDGELDSQREYVKNLVIPIFPNLRYIARRLRGINAIASADSESLDEESGL